MSDSTSAPVISAVSAPAAAPASPAPAAAPTPSPSPQTAPAGSSPAAGTSVMDSFDKQFIDLEDAPAKANSQPTGETKVDHPIDPKPAAESPKPIGEQLDAPKPADLKPDDESFDGPQVGSIKEIRGWGRRMADMARNAIKRSKEMESKLAEAEARGTVPPDVAKIQSDYQRAMKELEDHKQRVARSDYSQSKDYEQQFKQPYHQAFSRGRMAVKELMVREVDENGIIVMREGTPADWDKLYEMSNSAADEAIEKMFGPSARRVQLLRDQAKERGEAAYNAIQENTTKFTQERKQAEAQMAQRRLALQGLWKKVNGDLQTKHSQWFSEREGDAEWNQALAKGREIAQQRFGPAYAQLAPEQRVVLDAQVFNRAAAFTPLRSQITRLESKLAEAQKTIDQLRSSGPGKPQAGATAPEGPSKDWEGQFDKQVG